MLVAYLLERCLCQFGYVHIIPISVRIVSVRGTERWFRSNVMKCVTTIIENMVDVSLLG